jgi:hypothetical protein
VFLFGVGTEGGAAAVASLAAAAAGTFAFAGYGSGVGVRVISDGVGDCFVMLDVVGPLVVCDAGAALGDVLGCCCCFSSRSSKVELTLPARLRPSEDAAGPVERGIISAVSSCVAEP